MGHQEVDQSRGATRLSCQTMVRAYCDSFSFGGPLPGGTRLAVLRRHSLRYGLKVSDRKGIVKKREKGGSGRLEGGGECILDSLGLISSSEQRKTDQKMGKLVCGALFERTAA